MAFEFKTNRDHFEEERARFLSQSPHEVVGDRSPEEMNHFNWLKHIHEAMFVMAPNVVFPDPMRMRHAGEVETLGRTAECKRTQAAFHKMRKLDTDYMLTSALEFRLITFARLITEVSDEMLAYNAGPKPGEYGRGEMHTYEWFEDLLEFMTDCGMSTYSSYRNPGFTATFKNEATSKLREMTF